MRLTSLLLAFVLLSTYGEGMRHRQSHSVELNWVRSATADVTSYNIHRKILGGTYSIIASVPSPTATWTDTNVISGKTYVYATTAFDSDGDGESIYSDEVTVTI